MTQIAGSMICFPRHKGVISLLLVLLCSHHTCQSFQQTPTFLTTRSSLLTSTTPTRSLKSNRHYYTDPSSSNIHDQTPPSPSFDQRMREHLKRYQSSQRSTRRTPSSNSSSTSPSSSPQLVPDVRSLQEYKEVLDKAGEDEKMLAVLWYSPWCKACRAVMPGIRTLAKRHPDVQFIKVPVLEENANLHQGLDVPSVPFLHLYMPEDPRLVEEKKMTRKRLSGFQKSLCDYEKGYCSLEQLEGDDVSGNGVWSTSNPYSISSRSVINTKTPRTNFPEATPGKFEVVTP